MGWPLALVMGAALVWAIGPAVALAWALVAMVSEVLVSAALVSAAPGSAALALVTELEELEAPQPLRSQL